MKLKPAQPCGWCEVVSFSGSQGTEGGVLGLAWYNLHLSSQLGEGSRSSVVGLLWLASFHLARRGWNCPMVTGKGFGMVIIAQ